VESLVRAKCFNEIFGIFPIELELKCSDFSDYFISFIAACVALHKERQSKVFFSQYTEKEAVKPL